MKRDEIKVDDQTFEVQILPSKKGNFYYVDGYWNGWHILDAKLAANGEPAREPQWSGAKLAQPEHVKNSIMRQVGALVVKREAERASV